MIVGKTLENVEAAIKHVFGISEIQRRTSLNLSAINKTPYATIIVSGVEYGSETFGYDHTTCTITGAVLFKNENDLIAGMDNLRDFAAIVADGIELHEMSFQRLSNEKDIKAFNYGMIFTIITGG